MRESKTILITRPDHEYLTKYLCIWSERVVKLARDKGHDVHDLKGPKATRKELESRTQAKRPSFLFMNGHGNRKVITGHNDEPVIDEHSNLSGVILYARSCDAGHELGPKLMGGGMRAFIGYNRKFILGYTPQKIMHPETDAMAELFLEPSNLVATTIIKGHQVAEAHRRSKDGMYKNFRRMLSGAATYEERRAASWMWSNINGQVLLGDATAKM